MKDFLNQKWYDNKGLVFFLCLLIFPLGLYALWKNKSISLTWKYFVSAFFFVLIIYFIVKQYDNRIQNNPITTQLLYSNKEQNNPKNSDQNKQIRSTISTEDVMTSLYGKWVLDSNIFEPTIQEQTDTKYLKNKGRVREDGMVVLYNKKSYSKKGDFFQIDEYTIDGNLNSHFIYDGGKNYSKHFDQRSHFTYTVDESIITVVNKSETEKSFKSKYFILKLDAKVLIYRLEDQFSTDQIFCFSKLNE